MVEEWANWGGRRLLKGLVGNGGVGVFLRDVDLWKNIQICQPTWGAVGVGGNFGRGVGCGIGLSTPKHVDLCQ